MAHCRIGSEKNMALRWTGVEAVAVAAAVKKALKTPFENQNGSFRPDYITSRLPLGRSHRRDSRAAPSIGYSI